jgi:hypothetical protein
VLAEERERFCSGARAVRLETHARQSHAEELANVRFVIDDEYVALAHVALCFHAARHSTEKRPPCEVSTYSSRALLASQTSRAI